MDELRFVVVYAFAGSVEEEDEGESLLPGGDEEKEDEEEGESLLPSGE